LDQRSKGYVLNQPVEATIKAGTKLSGVLRHLQLRTPAVVLAEGWPSWLEVLSAIGFQDVKVWCQDADILSTYFRDSQGDYIFDHLNNLSQISKFGSPMLFRFQIFCEKDLSSVQRFLHLGHRVGQRIRGGMGEGF
jgi:hypothetical protein